MNEPAIIVLTANGQETAKRISAALPDAEIFVRRGRAIDGTAFDDTGEILRNLFTNGRTIIGVRAAGILIRFAGARLEFKTGRTARARRLRGRGCCHTLAGRTSGRQPSGGGTRRNTRRAIRHHHRQRPAVRRGVRRSAIRLGSLEPGGCKCISCKIARRRRRQLHGTADWVTNSDLPLSESGDLIIEVAETPTEGGPDHLVYHKRDLAIGIGCERDTSADEIRNLVTQVLTTNSLPREAIAGIWTIDLKMDEPRIADTATSFGVPLRFFGPDTLEAETPRLANPSEVVFREVGAHGVAEAAALAAAGAEKARLLHQKLRVSVRPALSPVQTACIEGHLGTGRPPCACRSWPWPRSASAAARLPSNCATLKISSVSKPFRFN